MTRSIILPFIIILASIAVVFMYTMPTYERVKSLKLEETQLTVTLDNANKIVGLVDSLKLQYDSFPAETREKLQTMLPDVIEPVDVVVEVNNLASGRVFLSDVSVGSANEGDTGAAGAVIAPRSPYNTTKITYAVSSNYSNILEFINRLERNLRLTDINRIELTSDDETGFIDVLVDTSTYWLNE